MKHEPVKAVVLLSGGGRTLENILRRVGKGTLALDIAGVVSSRSQARGLAVAKDAGIPGAVFKRKDYPSTSAHNEAINNWLRPLMPRMIILAGYLCYYMPTGDFMGPVVNIHPALLPRYGGKGYFGEHVHRAVLAAGEKTTGCTVHLVDEHYDHGRILGQLEVPVRPDDDVSTLAARVFAAECELYPRVLQELVEALWRSA